MGSGCCGTPYPFAYGMRRSIDEKFRGFPAVLGTSVAQLVSWRFLTRFSRPATQNNDSTTNRQGSLFSIPSTHQTTHFSTPGFVLWLRCIAVCETGRKMACDFWIYFSFFGHSGKIGRYAGIVGLKLCNNPGTLSSSLRYDCRSLKKSFAGFVRFFLVWWGYDWILDGDSQILRAVEKRRWCSYEYASCQ